jgi:hypothetical protein
MGRRKCSDDSVAVVGTPQSRGSVKTRGCSTDDVETL